MVWAHAAADVQDIVLPLDQSGWHKVYLGLWNPDHAHDGEAVPRGKFTSDEGYRILNLGGSPDTPERTSIIEVFVDERDLTDQDLVFSKSFGPRGKSAYFAYVKLVPMSDEEIAQAVADKTQPRPRNLIATI